MLEQLIRKKLNSMLFILIVMCCSVPITNGQYEFKEFFKHKPLSSIGRRVPGDNLIIDDTVMSTISSNNESNSIRFHYPITNHILTLIEYGSDSNVELEIQLGVSGDGGHLTGSVSNSDATGRRFNFKIVAYGLLKTEETENIDSILMPELKYNMKLDTYNIDDAYIDESFEDEHEKIKFGYRQPGDQLLHKERKASYLSDIRKHHSITFHYVDSSYITAVVFEASSASLKSTVEYSHMTEHTLKVVLHDDNVFELDAEMLVYGYRPNDLPESYLPPFPDLTRIDPNLEGIKLMEVQGTSRAEEIDFGNAIDLDSPNQNELSEIDNLEMMENNEGSCAIKMLINNALLLLSIMLMNLNFR